MYIQMKTLVVSSQHITIYSDTDRLNIKPKIQTLIIIIKIKTK